MALALLAIGKAATLKFREKERAISQEAHDEMQKLGLTAAQAKAKYPTPEIDLVTSGCLTPGGTGEIVVKGKFVPGAKLVVESDAIEVTKETLTPTEYRATVKVAPDVPPHSATVRAFRPVSGITASIGPGVVIGGRMEWTIEAANGWKVVARSPAAKACNGASGEDPYDMQFFRKGETAPFETRTAKGTYSMFDSEEYFEISDEPAGGSPAQQKYAEIMKTMSDPKATPAQREKAMADLQKAQQQMMADIASPGYAQQQEAKKKQFGCQRIDLQLQGAGHKGSMRCSDAVGTSIAVTGSMKSLGR